MRSLFQRSRRKPDEKGTRTKQVKSSDQADDHKLTSKSTFPSGVKQLHTGTEDVVDLIFVHGLTGDREMTWTAGGADRPWPPVLLPPEFPNARILTFGYDANVVEWRGVVSVNKIGNHAMNLLTSVAAFRDKTNTALSTARRRSEEYLRKILLKTRAIAFLGTPHRGAGLAWWAQRLARSVGLIKQTNSNIVKVLEQESEILARIQDDFHNMLRARGPERLQNTEITCFYEELPLSGIGIVVPQESASIPPYVAIGIHRNHTGMTKFEDKDDPGFVALAGELRRWIKTISEETRSLSERSFSPSESKYVASFHPSYLVDLDDRVQGTCSWALQTPQYLSWKIEDASAILWLTGNAGSGKTMVTDFLAQHLKEQSIGTYNPSSKEMVCYFFCAKDVQSQNTAQALLKTIIWQILSRWKELIHRLKHALTTLRIEYDVSLEALWQVFEMSIDAMPCPCIYIIVDALDECEERSRNRLLSRIFQRPGNLRSSTRSQPKLLKFIFTGRPQIRASCSMDAGQFHHFYIRIEDQPEGTVTDVIRYIDYRIHDLVTSSICSRSTAETLKQSLYARAENSFLWVNVVLNHIKTSLKYFDADLHQMLNDLPQDLQDTYTKYLPQILPTEVQTMRTYLYLIIGCTRPLSLREVDAFAGLGRHSQNLWLDTEGLSLVQSSLERALGPLVRFSNGMVQFIHSTVKDFFLHLHKDQDHPLRAVHGVELASAHLFCAQSCIRYLRNDAIPKDLFNRTNSFYESTAASPVSVRQDKSPFTAAEDNEDILAGIFDIQDVAFLKDETSFQDDACQVIQDHFGAYDYAARSWTYHWSQSEHMASEDLVREVTDLFFLHSNDWYILMSHKSRTEMPEPTEAHPLVLAALFDHPRILRSLLARPENQQLELSLHEALFWAASRGNVRSVRILLEFGASVMLPASGRLPLATAVRGGFTEVCLLLLEKGNADPNCWDDRGSSPFSIAARHDDAQILHLLLKTVNVDVNQKDYAGRTGLIEACATASSECVKTILADGRSNVNSKDNKGRNALHHASMSGNRAALKALLGESVLERDANDVEGRNAMSLASQCGNLAIVRMLYRAGVSAEAVDLGGRNSISWAANSARALSRDHDDESVLQYLIRKFPGSSDTPDIWGWTPLAWALDRPGYLEAARVLQQDGYVNINHQDTTFGRSILAWAASEGFTDIVEYLLGCPGIQKNQKSYDGRSPLSYAATNGMVDTVHALLRNQDVLRDLPDEQGRTAADWARLNGNDEIVALLEQPQGGTLIT